ncbi:MAG: hypothetical protein PHV33_07095 [Elusimicrobiales bacterium]|nr:hypothetical protein [Elusimicrobiales bacterium]
MKKFIVLLAGLFFCYLLLLAKPEFYFSKSVAYKCFTLRAHGELPASTEASLDAAYEKLAASELFKENDSFEIIVPKTRGEFLFFTPLLKGRYSRVNPFHGAIYLAAADFAKGDARAEPGAPDFRKLSSEIAGAAARDQARRRFRPLSYLFRNDWEIRGYSSRVSGLTSDFSPSDACTAATSPDLEDFRYGLMLETVLKEDNISFTDLLDRNMSYEKAEERLKRAHCGG